MAGTRSVFFGYLARDDIPCGERGIASDMTRVSFKDNITNSDAAAEIVRVLPVKFGQYRTPKPKKAGNYAGF